MRVGRQSDSGGRVSEFRSNLRKHAGEVGHAGDRARTGAFAASVSRFPRVDRRRPHVPLPTAPPHPLVRSSRELPRLSPVIQIHSELNRPFGMRGHHVVVASHHRLVRAVAAAPACNAALYRRVPDMNGLAFTLPGQLFIRPWSDLVNSMCLLRHNLSSDARICLEERYAAATLTGHDEDPGGDHRHRSFASRQRPRRSTGASRGLAESNSSRTTPIVPYRGSRRATSTTSGW